MMRGGARQTRTMRRVAAVSLVMASGLFAAGCEPWPEMVVSPTVGTAGSNGQLTSQPVTSSHTGPQTTPGETPSPTTTPTDTSPGWLSGGGGSGVADGSFSRWRGSEVEIATTWADDENSSSELWALLPGAEYGDWTKPIEIAVGAFDAGGSWEAAARGDYDARWRASLTKMAQLRAGRETTYIRFAHEFNGDWYAWSVQSGDLENFKAAWARYRAIQREVFPSAKLVLCVNKESLTDIDWRDAYPGPGLVDVMSVDYYNQFPFVMTATQWTSSINELTWRGEPKGLALHLAFARSVGLPFAISEWSESADFGDSAQFPLELHGYLVSHAGTGPGEILYESLFNVDRDSNNWALYPATRMPLAADTYRRLW